MMPRLVKLISDRKARSSSPSSLSRLGRAWKRILAYGSKDQSSSPDDGAGAVGGAHVAQRISRLERRRYERLGEVEELKSEHGRERKRRTEDVELGMPTVDDVRDLGNLLEQRLNIGFTVPDFSFLARHA